MEKWLSHLDKTNIWSNRWQHFLITTGPRKMMERSKIKAKVEPPINFKPSLIECKFQTFNGNGQQLPVPNTLSSLLHNLGFSYITYAILHKKDIFDIFAQEKLDNVPLNFKSSWGVKGLMGSRGPISNSPFPSCPPSCFPLSLCSFLFLLSCFVLFYFLCFSFGCYFSFAFIEFSCRVRKDKGIFDKIEIFNSKERLF